MRLVFRAIVVFLLISLQTINIAAQDTNVQETKIKQLEKEISQIQKQISELGTRSNNALNELSLIRRQISTRKDLVSESDREIKVLEDSIKLVRAHSESLQHRIDTLMGYHSRLIRSAYKNRDARIWYVHILSSRNFSQASRRYNYLKNLSSQMSRQVAEMKETQDELENELRRLDKLRADAAELRLSRQRDLEKLRSDEKRANTLVANLKANRTRYQNQLNTKRRQVESLNKEIERIIAQYIKEQNSSKKGASTAKTNTVDIKLASEFKANKGKLPWPADGPVLEKFGRSRHEIFTSIVMPFNNGIGIGLDKNAEVSAVFSGEVKRVIKMAGYNICVLVQHGNYFTFYCKLSSVNVKAGDSVATGQTIGKVDTIEGQTLLHLEVWEGTTPQNPELWLRKR